MIASAWNETELLAMFARVCDGLAEPAEIERLDHRLANDPRARQLWWEYVGIHGGVTQHLGERASLVDWPRVFAATTEAPIATKHASDERPESATSMERTWRRITKTAQMVSQWARRYPVISCTAALVVVSLGVAMLAVVNLPERRQGALDHASDPKFVAQLTDAVQATWDDGQIGGAVGSHLQAGHIYHLQSGIAEISFRRGVKVVLEGPAEFQVTSANAGRLRKGKLVANVPPQARGFVIETRGGRVTDLGTRFAVDVSVATPAVENVTVHCFRGEISFAPPRQEPWLLTAGQGVEVTTAGLRRIAALPASFVHDVRLRSELQRDARGLIIDKRFTHNAAFGKKVTQSTVHASFDPQRAVDGNPTNFTHTDASDTNPWLSIDLGQLHDIDAVFLHNRDECCGGRLSDVVVEILGEDGQSVLFASKKLNENNQLNAPPMIAVGLPEATGDVVRGRHVRIRRIPQSGDAANAANLNVLSLGEVQVFATPVAFSPVSTTASTVSEDGHP